MSSKQLQVNRSGRQRHAAWGMSQCSDKWSVQYEMGTFCFFFYKISCVKKLIVERQTGLQPESNQNQRIEHTWQERHDRKTCSWFDCVRFLPKWPVVTALVHCSRLFSPSLMAVCRGWQIYLFEIMSRLDAAVTTWYGTTPLSGPKMLLFYRS